MKKAKKARLTTHRSIVIRTPTVRYPILFGNGILNRASSLIPLLAHASRVMVLADETVLRLHRTAIKRAFPQAAISPVPSGEQNKNMRTVQKIWKRMFQNACDRSSVVVNIGGGMACDTGGFAAATFMRGIPFVHIPTTLLAQTDASIGGKVGVNFGRVKNAVGCFAHPRAVLIDTAFLATLPQREFYSGCAEIIKHALIADRAYAAKLLKAPLSHKGSQKRLPEIIARSCRIKRKVVAADETETGKRKILNFGHTVGHAIESLSHRSSSPLLHGEAVAVGMHAEAVIAQRYGLLAEKDVTLIQTLLRKHNLPTAIPKKMSHTAIISLMRKDKKNAAGVIRCTLLEAIGKAIFDVPTEERVIRSALAQLSRV